MLIPLQRAEIIQIWQQHHAAGAKNGTSGVAAVDSLSASEFSMYQFRAKQAPLFVVPCFRTAAAENGATPDSTVTRFDVHSGYETMLVNAQPSSILFTSLEEYKKRGAANASPFAITTFYSDLSASHDLCLARVELMDVSVSALQLRQMWQLVKGIYSSTALDDSQRFHRFAVPFNTKPGPSIDFEAYVQECKTIVEAIRWETTDQLGGMVENTKSQ
jgi:hypothetical protein